MMKTLKRIAEQACRDLAFHILNGENESQNWRRADRIERRWHIQGATLFVVDHWKARHRQYLAEQSRKHDRQHPDRLTYLHR